MDWAVGPGFGDICEAHHIVLVENQTFKSAIEFRQRHVLKLMHLRGM